MKKIIFSGILMLAVFAIVSCEKETVLTKENPDQDNPEEVTTQFRGPIIVTMSSPGIMPTILGCFGPARCYYPVVVWESTIQNNLDGTVTTVDHLSEMNEENYDYYTTNTIAILEEPCYLSEEDCLGLGVSVGTAMQPGSYPITIAGDDVIVTYDID